MRRRSAAAARVFFRGGLHFGSINLVVCHPLLLLPWVNNAPRSGAAAPAVVVVHLLQNSNNNGTRKAATVHNPSPPPPRRLALKSAAKRSFKHTGRDEDEEMGASFATSLATIFGGQGERE